MHSLQHFISPALLAKLMPCLLFGLRIVLEALFRAISAWFYERFSLTTIKTTKKNKKTTVCLYSFLENELKKGTIYGHKKNIPKSIKEIKSFTLIQKVGLKLHKTIPLKIKLKALNSKKSFACS